MLEIREIAEVFGEELELVLGEVEARQLDESYAEVFLKIKETSITKIRHINKSLSTNLLEVRGATYRKEL